MDEIERKLIEIESRNKRSNIIYVLAGISILAIVGSLIIFSNAKRISLEKDQEIIELQSETLRDQQQMNDSLKAANKRYDSLKKYTEGEIHKLQLELLSVKKSTNNSSVKSSIVSIQNRVSQMDTRIHKVEVSTTPIKTSAVSKSYNIRMYSYNPDPKRKKVLIAILKQENYAVKVYPDWSKKPSFFSSSATILYYSDKTRKAAERLSGILAKKANFKFKISKGAGLGISEKEKQNTFIIHYQKDEYRLK
jgi:hypothetical protein